MAKTPRNAPCPCGSGRKYKHCCLNKPAEPAAAEEDADSFSLQARGYRGPDGAYAPAIEAVLESAPTPLMLVRTDKRYEKRADARLCAGKDLGAAEAAGGSAFSDSGGVVPPLRTIGYDPLSRTDLGVWQERLEELAPEGHPRCGLCGNTINLMRTECCNNWICNDHDSYVAFSYARNSCARNHDRFTLCGSHHVEQHEGHWKDCEECREIAGTTEEYVFYGTNEYNFEVLEDPPDYEPTHCAECGRVLNLSEGGFVVQGGPDKEREYYCESCVDLPKF